jgi:pimeloyl-ACP methyl ester carboxylesterase
MKIPRSLRVLFQVSNLIAPRLGGIVAANVFTTPRKHARPAWEQEIIGRGRAITIAGRYSATAWGPTEGKPVILLHGWEGRGAQLGYFVDPLVVIGHRVIAVDGPAHGESPGRRAGPFLFADALMDIDRELGPLRAVVGHSMGGAAACIAIGRGLRVDSLVLLGAPSDFSEVLDQYAGWMQLPSRVRAAFRAEMARRTGQSTIEVGQMAEVARAFTKPVLVIHDPSDEEVPVHNGRRAAETFPDSQYVEIEAGGHRRMLKHDAVIAAVVSFLAKGNGTP